MLAFFDLLIAPKGWLALNGVAVRVVSYPDLTALKFISAEKNAAASAWYRCDNPSNPNGSRNPTGAYLVLSDDRGEFFFGLGTMVVG